MKEQHKSLLLTGLLVVIVAFIAFVAGTTVGRWHAVSGLRSPASIMNRPGWASGKLNYNPRARMLDKGKVNLNGTITAINGNQVTLRMTDGTSRTVTLSSSTQYTQLTSVTQTSLKNGQNVTISNLPVQNGSSSAQVVRINPTQ